MYVFFSIGWDSYTSIVKDEIIKCRKYEKYIYYRATTSKATTWDEFFLRKIPIYNFW